MIIPFILSHYFTFGALTLTSMLLWLGFNWEELTGPDELIIVVAAFFAAALVWPLIVPLAVGFVARAFWRRVVG